VSVKTREVETCLLKKKHIKFKLKAIANIWSLVTSQAHEKLESKSADRIMIKFGVFFFFINLSAYKIDA